MIIQIEILESISAASPPIIPYEEVRRETR